MHAAPSFDSIVDPAAFVGGPVGVLQFTEAVSTTVRPETGVDVTFGVVTDIAAVAGVVEEVA